MAELILTINARQGKKGATEFTVSTDRVAKSATRAAAATGRLEKRMASAGKTGAVVGSQFRALFAGFTAVIALRAATKTITEFEESMVVLKNVLRLTDDEALKPFIKTAKQLGATTRFTATEVGDGLLFLARAGFTASESLDAIGGTLNLATAGLLALGDAADLASNVVSQFNLAAAETDRVGNDLVVVANRANTSVRQLGEALKFAGPVASLAGDSLEDTTAIIGVLGDAGIQATLAGTGLRQSILRLVNPTAQAQKAIKAMGLEVADVNPALVGTVEAFRRLGEKTLEVDSASEIFGARTAAVAAIASQATVKIDDLVRAQKENRDEAKKLAEELEATLGGAFRALAASTEGLFLALGEGGLGGAMESVVRGATSVIRVLAGVSEEGEALSPTAVSVAAAVKGIAAAFAVLAALKIAAIFVGITKALVAFNIAAFASPIGLLTKGVALAAAAYTIFTNRIDDAAASLRRLGEAQEEERQRSERFALQLERALAQENFAEATSLFKNEIVSIETAIDDATLKLDKFFLLRKGAISDQGTLVQDPTTGAFSVEGRTTLDTREDVDRLPLTALEPGSFFETQALDKKVIDDALSVFERGDITEKFRQSQTQALESVIALLDQIDKFQAIDAGTEVGPLRLVLGLEAGATITAEALERLGITAEEAFILAAEAIEFATPKLEDFEQKARDAAIEELRRQAARAGGLLDVGNAQDRLNAAIEEEIRLAGLSPVEKQFERFKEQAITQAAVDRAEIPKGQPIEVEGFIIDETTLEITLTDELTASLKEKAAALLAVNNAAKGGVSTTEKVLEQLRNQIELQEALAQGGELEARIVQTQQQAGTTDAAELEELRQGVLALKAAEDAAALSRGEASSSLEGFIDALKDEQDLASKSAADREFELLQREALAKAQEDHVAGKIGEFTAIDTEIELTDELIAVLRELANARTAGIAAERDSLTQAEQTIQALQDQIAVQRLTLLEARQLREVQSAGPDATVDELAVIKSLVAQAEAAERIRAAADGIASAFAAGFEDLVFQVDSLRDVLQNLANDLSRLFLRQFALGPLADLFSTGLTNLFNTGGAATPSIGSGNLGGANAILGGGVIPFAHGGMIEKPTLLLPLGGGPAGIAGEAGPERITPGRGNPDGGGGNVTNRITFNISTPNADSFRQSQSQITADLQRAMRRESIGT